MMQRNNPFYKIERTRRHDLARASGLTLNQAQRLMQKVKSWEKIQELLATNDKDQLLCIMVHGVEK